MVTRGQRFSWDETPWDLGERLWPAADGAGIPRRRHRLRHQAQHSAPACRQGLRGDGGAGNDIGEDILALKPDGVFLSNGPGDPAATGEYAVPVIRKLIDKVPTFGICLGHQMLGLALGGKTMKMHQGHHGANHPVKDLATGKVEITSMNHGFAVDRASLPANVERDARLAVRRLQLRPRAQGPAGVLGAVPPRSFAGAARQPLSVRAVRRDDARAKAERRQSLTCHAREGGHPVITDAAVITGSPAFADDDSQDEALLTASGVISPTR